MPFPGSIAIHQALPLRVLSPIPILPGCATIGPLPALGPRLRPFARGNEVSRLRFCQGPASTRLQIAKAALTPPPDYCPENAATAGRAARPRGYVLPRP